MGFLIVGAGIVSGADGHVCLSYLDFGRAGNGGVFILRHLVIDGVIAGIGVSGAVVEVVDAIRLAILHDCACGRVDGHGDAVGFLIVSAGESACRNIYSFFHDIQCDRRLVVLAFFDGDAGLLIDIEECTVRSL